MVRPSEGKKRRINVKITQEEFDLLDKLSQSTGTTKSDLIRQFFPLLEKGFPSTSELEHDLSELVFWSFRYAMGRRSAAVSTVADLVIKYKQCLHKNDRDHIIKEITEAIERGRAGDECDQVDWKRVKKELKELEEEKSLERNEKCFDEAYRNWFNENFGEDI